MVDFTTDTGTGMSSNSGSGMSSDPAGGGSQAAKGYSMDDTDYGRGTSGLTEARGFTTSTAKKDMTGWSTSADLKAQQYQRENKVYDGQTYVKPSSTPVYEGTTSESLESQVPKTSMKTILILLAAGVAGYFLLKKKG